MRLALLVTYAIFKCSSSFFFFCEIAWYCVLFSQPTTVTVVVTLLTNNAKVFVRWCCSQKSRRKSESGWLHENVGILAELCHDCCHPTAVLFFMCCRRCMCDVLTASLDVFMTPKYWTWYRVWGINCCWLCWVYSFYCIWLQIWCWYQRRICI